MPTVGEFAFGPGRADTSASIRRHEDIGRNLPIDLGIVSCELAALEALADAVPRDDARRVGRGDRRGAQEVRGSERSSTTRPALGYTDAVHPAVIAKELGDFLYRGKLPKEQTTIASGGYGIARYVRRELRGYPSRPDHERRLSVRRDRSGRRLRGRRRRGRAARRRAAGRLQGPSDHLHHRRRRLRLHGDGDRHHGEVQAAGRRSSSTTTTRGARGRRRHARSAGAADSPVPGEPALRQARRSARRARRVRDAAGGVPAGARARLPGGRARRPAGGHQLPGEEGILGSREVPARHRSARSSPA